MTWRQSSWCRGLAVLTTVVLFAATTGCEKSPEQKLRRAKVLLTKEQSPDTAQEKLEAVLEAQPDNLEAKRLMAKVYRLRGQYGRAEEQLDKLWKNYGFDEADQQASGQVRKERELIRSEYVNLYREWAEEIDPDQQPDKYVEVVRRGLDRADKDVGLDFSMKLAKYYWRRGQELVEAGDKKAAADAFSTIEQLRTIRGWEKRKRARKKARDLRLEFFKKHARKRFDDEAKPLIEELDGFEFDGEKRVIRIDLRQTVDRSLDPDKSEDRKKAKKMAFVGLIDKLRKLALTTAGLSRDTNLVKIGTDRAKEILLRNLEFDKEAMTYRRGLYEIKAVLPVDGAIQMAYAVKTAYEEVEPRDEEGDGADAGTTGSSADAGSGDAGGAGASP